MCSVLICIVLHYRTAEYCRTKVKDFNGQHCMDTLKCCCSLIKWKHHAIIFTWIWTFLSHFLLDTLWQRNFSPSVKLLLTALRNAAMKSALCKTNATVSSSITVHQDIPHIYMKKTFFQGVFSTILLSLLCFWFMQWKGFHGRFTQSVLYAVISRVIGFKIILCNFEIMALNPLLFKKIFVLC